MTAGQSSSTPNPGDEPPLGGTLVAADAGEGRAEGNGLSDSQQISASFPGRMCANWGGGKSAGLEEPLPCLVLLPSSAITSCGARPPPADPTLCPEPGWQPTSSLYPGTDLFQELPWTTRARSTTGCSALHPNPPRHRTHSDLLPLPSSHQGKI